MIEPHASMALAPSKSTRAILVDSSAARRNATRGLQERLAKYLAVAHAFPSWRGRPQSQEKGRIHPWGGGGAAQAIPASTKRLWHWLVTYWEARIHPET
jgi:hypothetical protein